MNKIDKEKVMPYVKFYGIWLVYFVVLGVINTKISYNAAQSPELIEKYVRSTSSLIIPILMILPFLAYFGIGIVSLIRVGIALLKKKDAAKFKKITSDSFIFLAVCYLVGGIYYNIFPDHVMNNLNKINVENNKVKIENNINKEESDQIGEEIKKDNNNFPILRIKNNDCPLLKKEASASADNCQNGDIEVVAGRTYYCGPNCGQGYEKNYLMRKIENKWQIIKVLGENKWTK